MQPHPDTARRESKVVLQATLAALDISLHQEEEEEDGGNDQEDEDVEYENAQDTKSETSHSRATASQSTTASHAPPPSSNGLVQDPAWLAWLALFFERVSVLVVAGMYVSEWELYTEGLSGETTSGDLRLLLFLILLGSSIINACIMRAVARKYTILTAIRVPMIVQGALLTLSCVVYSERPLLFAIAGCTCASTQYVSMLAMVNDTKHIEDVLPLLRMRSVARHCGNVVGFVACLLIASTSSQRTATERTAGFLSLRLFLALSWIVLVLLSLLNGYLSRQPIQSDRDQITMAVSVAPSPPVAAAARHVNRCNTTLDVGCLHVYAFLMTTLSALAVFYTVLSIFYYFPSDSSPYIAINAVAFECCCLLIMAPMLSQSARCTRGVALPDELHDMDDAIDGARLAETPDFLNWTVESCRVCLCCLACCVRFVMHPATISSPVHDARSRSCTIQCMRTFSRTVCCCSLVNRKQCAGSLFGELVSMVTPLFLTLGFGIFWATRVIELANQNALPVEIEAIVNDSALGICAMLPFALFYAPTLDRPYALIFVKSTTETHNAAGHMLAAATVQAIALTVGAFLATITYADPTMIIVTYSALLAVALLFILTYAVTTLIDLQTRRLAVANYQTRMTDADPPQWLHTTEAAEPPVTVRDSPDLFSISDADAH